jgi:hypothetical protein
MRKVIRKLKDLFVSSMMMTGMQLASQQEGVIEEIVAKEWEYYAAKECEYYGQIPKHLLQKAHSPRQWLQEAGAQSL